MNMKYDVRMRLFNDVIVQTLVRNFLSFPAATQQPPSNAPTNMQSTLSAAYINNSEHFSNRLARQAYIP